MAIAWDRVVELLKDLPAEKAAEVLRILREWGFGPNDQPRAEPISASFLLVLLLAVVVGLALAILIAKLLTDG